MPTAIPALQGKFGDTEYYLTTMKVGEFVRTVRLPRDIPGWEDLSIEERYQRDINLARVRKGLAPYFANEVHRFSGSLILAVMHDEGMVFEPLTKFGGRSGVPALYQSAAGDMGFLTMRGDEILVPLDGQHRAKAFKFAIDGVDDNNRPIEHAKSNTDLAQDQVSIILVRFEPTRARHIFSKINRYAKPTSKADNLITDDDDAMAVMTRELLSEEGVIPARLVKLGANTLNKTAPEFTTISTFYDSTIDIVKGLNTIGAGSVNQMTDEQRECVTEDVRRVWKKLLSGIDLWAKAVADASTEGDGTRREIREQTVLGKPIGQRALVNAFMTMRDCCDGVPEDELCKRLNRINWDLGDEIWHGVLMNPNGRIMSGKTTMMYASDFIAYMGGAEFPEDKRNKMLEHIYGADWRNKKLPTPVE